jgi:lipopolysaccharide/colanic/teichoic acid biosynthesis glycosyltransferase
MSTANPEIDEVTASSRIRVDLVECTYQSIKRGMDIALALVMLLVSAPLILLSVVLVRLNSRGPMFYTQRRLGLGGKLFTIYKIRTMYHDSERVSGPCWSVPGDPRVTRLGRVLRWSHVDELPQLINILIGDMSLVGPRPERPEFVEQLERALPDYRRRLLVRPGLTGLAQVQQPPDIDIFSVRRKLNYDLCYIEQMNVWLDFRVILGTVFKCLGVPFVWIGRSLQLPDPNLVIARDHCTSESGLAGSSLASNSYFH